MYFQKLRNEDDLYRVEIWKDRSKHGESRYNRGTKRSMNKYVRYKRWPSRGARVSVSKFDRNAILWYSGKWVEIHRVAETVELFLYFLPLPTPSSNDETKKVKSIAVIRWSSNSKHRVRGISSEAYVISRISRKRFSLSIYRERFICRWERPVSFWQSEDECCLRKWISLIFTFVERIKCYNYPISSRKKQSSFRKDEKFKFPWNYRVKKINETRRKKNRKEERPKRYWLAWKRWNWKKEAKTNIRDFYFFQRLLRPVPSSTCGDTGSQLQATGETREFSLIFRRKLSPVLCFRGLEATTNEFLIKSSNAPPPPGLKHQRA